MLDFREGLPVESLAMAFHTSRFKPVQVMIHVVDQNSMRKPLLGAEVANPGSLFVIPDAALEEMTKSSEWESTVRRSFELLAPAMDRVFFSASVGELLAVEQESRTPIQIVDMLPTALTEGTRSLVEAILAGSDRSGEFRDRLNVVRAEFQPQRLKAVNLKARMQDNVERLKRLYGPDQIKEMRGCRMGKDARLGLLKCRAEALVRDFVGFELSDTDPFWPSELLTVRLVYALLWRWDDWLIMGGVDDAKPETIVNDSFDLDYVLTSSFFDGLLSMDRRALRCASDLRIMSAPVEDDRLLKALEADAVWSGRIAPKDLSRRVSG